MKNYRASLKWLLDQERTVKIDELKYLAVYLHPMCDPDPQEVKEIIRLIKEAANMEVPDQEVNRLLHIFSMLGAYFTKDPNLDARVACIKGDVTFENLLAKRMDKLFLCAGNSMDFSKGYTPKEVREQRVKDVITLITDAGFYLYDFIEK